MIPPSDSAMPSSQRKETQTPESGNSAIVPGSPTGSSTPLSYKPTCSRHGQLGSRLEPKDEQTVFVLFIFKVKSTTTFPYKYMKSHQPINAVLGTSDWLSTNRDFTGTSQASPGLRLCFKAPAQPLALSSAGGNILRCDTRGFTSLASGLGSNAPRLL